jgi:hypothetical protein
MTDFHTAVADWASFYETLAAVAATFAGLLFVSLSLHLELLRSSAFRRAQSLARHTFSSFLFLVVFALIFLIPHHARAGLSIPLFIVGLVALGQTVFEAWHIRVGEMSPEIKLPRLFRIYVLSALTYLVLVIVAVLLLMGATAALYVLVGPLIWHLAWTTRSAWDLLFELRLDEAAPFGRSQPPA